jgi:hypothetical protein
MGKCGLRIFEAARSSRAVSAAVPSEERRIEPCAAWFGGAMTASGIDLPDVPLSVTLAGA